MIQNNYKEWKSNYKRFFEEATNYKEMPELQDKMYSMLQNKILYEASSGLELVRFYQRVKPKDNLAFKANQFYNVAFKNIFEDGEKGHIKITPIHVDLPNQISKIMCKLVFPARPTFMITGKQESEDEEKELLLEEMLNDNEFDTFIQDAAEKASYSGAIAIKFNIDKSESDYPIMEVYPKEDIEIYKKYGNRVHAIIFKDYYRANKKRYCLYSIYGKGFIDYKLYLVAKDVFTIKKEVPLTELEETKDLKPIKFVNKDGTECNKVLALYMENRPGAKSDYHGAVDEFLSLDEIRSNLILYLRTAKIKQYFHDNMVIEDEDGKLRIPDSYDTDNVIIRDSNPNWTESEIKRDIVDINNSVQGYKAAFEDILLQCLTTVGLSPSTVGFDPAGANSSGLALEIRERTTLHTREEKCQRWRDALINMVELLFIYNNMEVVGENYVVTNELEDNSISISFAEYGRSITELVDDLIKRLDAKLIDLVTAYEKLYPDLSEEERMAMIEAAEGLLPTEPEVPTENPFEDQPEEEIPGSPVSNPNEEEPIN